MKKKGYKKLNKKGVSIIIGYALLISLAVVMGGVMYAWMKSYVPKEPLACPDGSALTIRDYNYSCSTNKLNITIENNGRFDVAGYYLKGSNSNGSLSVIDLTQYVDNSSGLVFKFSNAILLSLGNNNSFSPEMKTDNIFNLSAGQTFYEIELTPVRWQKENNKLRFVSCGADSVIKQSIVCN